MVIVSPVWTAPIGPPWTASGATWATMKPWVAPEKRPSVMSATSSPSPSPTIAAVTASISRMPGPPAGPSLRMTTTSPALISPLVTAGHRLLLALEDARGALVVDALVAGELHDAAVGGEVAAQDREAAGGLDRVVERADDLLALGLLRLGGVLADRAAGDGHRVLVEAAELLQALDDDGHAAGLVQVGGDVAAAGLEVAQHRRGATRCGRSRRCRASTPASLAIASRCRTPLVEPPQVATAAIAFSSPALVMMSLGRWPRASTSITSLPVS